MGSHGLRRTTTCRLPDGRLISLRRLHAGDAEAVVALHQHLSDHDRYFRFFTAHPAHLDELANKLIQPNDGQCALGAFDDDRLIGVASYTVRADPAAAEIAIVVAQRDRSLGVGTALLTHLARIARAHGIRRFIADVLAQNDLMLAVLSGLGWPRERGNCGSVLHLDIGLPDRIAVSSPAGQKIS